MTGGRRSKLLLATTLLLSIGVVQGGAGLSLEETPSWRVILFLLGFLILSILVEHSIHKLDHYLQHRGKTGPRAALTKIKDELMLMGFISLVLIIAEDSILAICSNVSTSGVPVLGTKCVSILHKDVGLGSAVAGSAASSGAASATSSAASRRNLASQSTLAMIDYCCSLESSSAASSSSNSSSSRLLLSMGHPGRGLGGAANDCQCPCGQTPFIEQASLHQIHVLIFAYASIHIMYGMIVMALAQTKVSKWKDWEVWAQAPKDHIKKFNRPTKQNTNKCLRCCLPWFEQLYEGAFKSFGYAAMRKLFIVRHNLDNTFDFFKHVLEGLSHDFAEVLGIEWWMWIVAIAQILAEGYALPAVGAYISLFISLTVGYKLQLIADELKISLFDHYDTDGDGNVDDNELAVMLHVGKKKDDLESVEAKFWLGKPHLMLTMMQFCMWQNGQTLAGLLFYGSYFAGLDGSCYYVNRGVPAMVLSCVVCILTLLHASFVTVPTFSMVTHMHKAKREKDKLLDAHKFASKHGLHGLHRSHTVNASLMTQVYPTSSSDLEEGTVDEQIMKLEEKLNLLRDAKEKDAKARSDSEDLNIPAPAPPTDLPPSLAVDASSKN